jgi:hypothetical protein
MVEWFIMEVQGKISDILQVSDIMEVEEIMAEVMVAIDNI